MLAGPYLRQNSHTSHTFTTSQYTHGCLQGSHVTGSGGCLFHMVASFILDQYQQIASHTEGSIDHCHRIHTNIQHLYDDTHISHTRAPTAPRLTIKQKTQHPSHPLHKHTTYFNTPRIKTIINNVRYTTNIPTDPLPHSHYNRHKNDIRYIQTSIVSRYLATRDNNKKIAHLHHTLPALTIYFPVSLVASLANSEQINHLSSYNTYTMYTPNHIHHHQTPSVTPVHTAHIISSIAHTYAPHCHH